MRYVRSILLPLLVAAAVGGAVLAWPHGSLWQRRGPSMALLGFSDDEGRLVLLEHVTPVSRFERGTEVSCVEYEPRTGQERRRVKLDIPSAFDQIHISSSKDFRKLLMCGTRPRIEGTLFPAIPGDPSRECVCLLVDLMDGRLLGGPWNCESEHGVELSPDGRWIYVPNSWRSTTEKQILSAEDGTVRHRIPGEGGLRRATFDREGKTLAILVGRNRKQHAVVVDLASGKELHDWELPPFPQGSAANVPAAGGRDWWGIGSWDGQCLTLQTLEPIGPSRFRIVGHPFLVKGQSLHATPETPIPRIDGSDGQSYGGYAQGDTVSYFLPMAANYPAWTTRVLGWCDDVLGTKWQAWFQGRRCFAYYNRDPFVHRTTITIGEAADVRHNLSAGLLAIAERPDATGQAMLTVWNTRPGRRWPWALAGGVMGFAASRRLLQKRRDKLVPKALIKGSS